MDHGGVETATFTSEFPKHVPDQTARPITQRSGRSSGRKPTERSAHGLLARSRATPTDTMERPRVVTGERPRVDINDGSETLSSVSTRSGPRS